MSFEAGFERRTLRGLMCRKKDGRKTYVLEGGMEINYIQAMENE